MRISRPRRNCAFILRTMIILTFIIVFLWYVISLKKETDYLKTVENENIPLYTPIIPRNIIQTSKGSGDVDIPKNSFVLLNREYKYLHYNDSSSEQFVRETMPDYIFQTYKSLPRPVLQADYFRYIVLLVKGGIYSDVDTICLRPIDTWFEGTKRNGTGLIIGIEADTSLWNVLRGDYARQIQFVQWTIVAAPGHPVLHQVVKRIAEMTSKKLRENLTENQILEWTGPAVWTDVISDYLWNTYGFSVNRLKNLKDPILVGTDIYILPITGFSPGTGIMGSRAISDPQAMVQHLFAGSWRKKSN